MLGPISCFPPYESGPCNELSRDQARPEHGRGRRARGGERPARFERQCRPCHKGRTGVVSANRGRADRGRGRARFALLRSDHLGSGGRRPPPLCSGKRLGAENGPPPSGRWHGGSPPLGPLGGGGGGPPT